GVDRSRQWDLELERSLADTGRLVHGALVARGKLPVPFDHQRVLEELQLEVGLVDTGEVHDDLDRARRLVQVGLGPPARLHEPAHGAAQPDLTERVALARAHHDRVAVAQAPVTHGCYPRFIVLVACLRGQSAGWRARLSRRRELGSWVDHWRTRPSWRRRAFAEWP